MNGHEPQLPSAVKKQADAANELHRQLYPDQHPAFPGVAAPVVPGNTPPATPGLAPEFPVETIVVTPPAPAEPIPPPAPVTPAPVVPAPPIPAPVAPPAVTPPAPACENCVKWEQRFRVLQGKYDKEVPRLTYRVAYLENINEDLQKQITALQAPAAAPAAPASAPSASSLTSIADALRNSQDEKVKKFQENFPDVFEFVVNSVDQVAKATQEETARQKADAHKDEITRKQESFIARLNATHPDWQAICQTDVNWPVWLQQKDRYTNVFRADLLRGASQRFDPEPIVNMLTDFKAAYGIAPVVPAAPNHPAPGPITPPPPPGDPRTRFLTPPSGPGATPPATPPPAEPPITRAFINQFYNDKVKKNTAPYGGPEAMQVWEGRINQAVALGRVV